MIPCDSYPLCPYFVKDTVENLCVHQRHPSLLALDKDLWRYIDFSQKHSALPSTRKGETGAIGRPSEIHTSSNPTPAGAGAMEIRSRHSSYSAGTEEDEGMEEELSPFRGRSRSAPPNLWAAQRYGRELRRMSDEFEGSFKVSACVGCDGTYTGLPILLSRACRDL